MSNSADNLAYATTLMVTMTNWKLNYQIALLLKIVKHLQWLELGKEEELKKETDYATSLCCDSEYVNVLTFDIWTTILFWVHI